MEESVTVITNPTVSVRLTSTISSFEAVRRFNRGITIAEFKAKLELITGCPPASMKLQLFSTSDKFLLNLDSDESLLGSYPIDDDCRIHVTDCSGTLTGAFSNLSEVEKYEISEEAYEKRADSLRNFKKKNMNVRHLMEENVAKHQEVQEQKEEDEKAALASIAVGKRCQTRVPGQPAKTGTIMFVGTTDFKPGIWVGVKYDEPLGKNDGSLNGKRYFECELNYGAFVRPLTVTVGDFPEEDYGLDEM